MSGYENAHNNVLAYIFVRSVQRVGLGSLTYHVP